MKNFLKKVVVLVLIAESKIILRKYRPKIIAVTGSVGKTSTKDAIYTVLTAFTHVRKSQKSFNSEIGIPLTILGSANGWSNPILWLRTFLEGLFLIIFPHSYPKILILEVGADRPKDIENVVSWLAPDISVITKLSDVPVHVEFFASPEELKKEKSFLARGVKKTGALILNVDDGDVLSFKDLTTAKVMTTGFGEGATVRASDYKVVYENEAGIEHPVGVSFGVSYLDKNATVNIRGTIGVQHVYANLAAIAVGLREGFELDAIVMALNKHETPPGRMRILKGLNQTTIIDDSYNSSPVAQKEALETLRDLRVGGAAGAKKIAILGDMLELGSFSVAEHKAVGEKVAGIASVLLTVGVRARVIRESAIASGMNAAMAISFDDSRKAGEYARSMLTPGDVILVKGSQGTLRMERAVEEIMLERGKKSELLVRQEPEWQKR